MQPSKDKLSVSYGRKASLPDSLPSPLVAWMPRFGSDTMSWIKVIESAVLLSSLV